MKKQNMCSTESAGEKITGITGVILAGGASSRMKRNKALLPVGEDTFIGRVYRKLSGIFEEILLVTNTPELYQFLPCPSVPDTFPGAGALAGIHAGLKQSATPYIFVVACDMPLLNERLIRYIASRAREADVVIPENRGGVEPLHAIYARRCLPVLEESLSQGSFRIIDCFRSLSVQKISVEEVEEIDPQLHSFRNVNTPEEYQRLQESDLTGGP